MQVTDAIADMLTRIRNANSAKHDSVKIPASNMKKAIAQILVDEGYIKGFTVEEDGKPVPRIKLSENVQKITTPCAKEVWRLYDNWTGKAIADVLTLEGEEIDDSEDYEIFDPDYTWKRKVVTDFTAKKLLEPVFVKGKRVYPCYNINTIKDYCAKQVNTLWDEVKRFENPHKYYVDLSQKLWDEKNEMLKKANIK